METKHNLDRSRKWWGKGSNHKRKSKSSCVQEVLGDRQMAGFVPTTTWSSAAVQDRYLVESLKNSSQVTGMNNKEDPPRVFKLEMIEW